jgi:hypothetical protein
MGDAIFCFVVLMLVLIAAINLILSISTSMLLIKVFELVKVAEERHQMEEEAKRQARGLMNVDTRSFSA